jgi:glycosyltransferase involved in cell wall biosynthesis
VRIWILADVTRSVPGGMRRHMELHAEGLRRHGHEASLFFREDLGPGDALRRARMPGAESFLALRARCRAERPDIVNVHTQCAPAWIAARRTGAVSARVVVMSYAADEGAVELRRPRDVLRWLRAALPARSTYPFADGIWCVNQTDVDYYRDVYRVPAARVVRFPHAVADSFYAKEPQPERLPRRLLFVGSFIRRKGVDVLVPALERVVSDDPRVEVVLAGTQSGEAAVRAALGPRLAARAEVRDSVGDVELRELYRTSTLLLLPSRREGLPISMLEALASGCPVLTAANSGMLDTIVSGQNGWLEHSFEPERWAQRISAILADPEALANAARGAQASADEFKVDVVARRVADWYARLV